MSDLSKLRIKIFADGGTLDDIKRAAGMPFISGFTSNPTLAAKAGVTDYEAFARSAIHLAGDRPFSFEVFADDLLGMEREAVAIASWGKSVYVKIPVTTTRGESTCPIVARLAQDNIKVNVTAVFTKAQILQAATALGTKTPGVISIFAGRIADTGRDPEEMFEAAMGYCSENIQTIWASPREVLNLWQAEEAGADIITVGHDILAKLHLVGKPLEEYSLDTVKMFRDDAVKSGLKIINPSSYGGGSFG